MVKYKLNMSCLKCGEVQIYERTDLFFKDVKKAFLTSCIYCSEHIKANYLHHYENANVFNVQQKCL